MRVMEFKKAYKNKRASENPKLLNIYPWRGKFSVNPYFNLILILFISKSNRVKVKLT